MAGSRSSDSSLRQKLSRCINENLDYKERYQALKKVFSGIQDPNMKLTHTIKSSLVVNDGIDILVAILRLDDPLIPKLSRGFDIWDAKGPEWRYKYLMQHYAALSVRRLCEVGDRETSMGLVRLDKIVSSGVIDALIPHLYILECAAYLAAGVLKEISRFEIYRPLIIHAHALYPLCLLLNADFEAEKTGIRSVAECLHLLSCSCVDMMLSYTFHVSPTSSSSSSASTASNNNNPIIFNGDMLIQYCSRHIERSMVSSSSSTSTSSTSTSSSGHNYTQQRTDQDLLNTILCFANLTASYENINQNKSLVDREIIYQKVNIGQHICRALYASLNNSVPYLSMRWSHLDILSSILLLAGSTSGKKLILSMGVKSETSNSRIGCVSILMSCLKKSFEGRKVDELKILLEIFLHLTFEKEIANSLQNSKEFLGLIQEISLFVNSATSFERERNDEDNDHDKDFDHDHDHDNYNDKKEQEKESGDGDGDGDGTDVEKDDSTILPSNHSTDRNHHNQDPLFPCTTLARNILFVLSGNMTASPSIPAAAESAVGPRSEPISERSRTKTESVSRGTAMNRKETPPSSSSSSSSSSSQVFKRKKSAPPPAAAPPPSGKERKQSRQPSRQQSAQPSSVSTSSTSINSSIRSSTTTSSITATTIRTSILDESLAILQDFENDENDDEGEVVNYAAKSCEDVARNDENLEIPMTNNELEPVSEVISTAEEVTLMRKKSKSEEKNESILKMESPSVSTVVSPTSSRPTSAVTSLPPSQSPRSISPSYVMISYCWANQPLVLELCHHLKSFGVSYWLDVEKMYGNINDRMAEAIESCAAVMICLSSKYKLSANCRMEAEYSNVKRKRIIPLMVEDNYQPDGWLGLIISGKLWYDISTPTKIPQSVTSIMSELHPVLEQDYDQRMNQSAAMSLSISAAPVIQTTTTLSSNDQKLQQSPHDSNCHSSNSFDPLVMVPSSTFLMTGVGIGSDLLSSTSLDLFKDLLSGMENRLQDCIITNINRVEDQLNQLEKRIKEMEIKLGS